MSQAPAKPKIVVGRKSMGLAAFLPQPAPTPAPPPATAPPPTNADTIVATNEGPAAEIDPLDAFMNELDAVVETQKQQAAAKRGGGAGSAAAQEPVLMEQTEAGEGFVRSKDAAAKLAGYSEEDVYEAAKLAEEEAEEDWEYNSDGELVSTTTAAATGGSKRSATAAASSKSIEPLPRVKHSDVVYEPFKRQFYTQPAGTSAEAAAALRRQLDVTVECMVAGGPEPPAPITSFAELGLATGPHAALAAALSSAGYLHPTPVQAAALPVLMAGRDVIGIAQTGSGKTLAFVLPLVRHTIEQREIEAGEGPIGVILAPTRELATQALHEGPEIVVATPGRLIDHVREGGTSLARVTFLVLDEADRMFDMGFAAQVYSVCENTRPDRQTALFSATFPRRVQALAARAALGGGPHAAVRIAVGTLGQAAEDVAQQVVVVEHLAKWGWLCPSLPSLVRRGKVLVFVSSKAAADELTASINTASPPELRTATAEAAAAEVAASDVLDDFLASVDANESSAAKAKKAAAAMAKNLSATTPLALSLHGDKLQHERDTVIAGYRRGETRILVATDVAARGLDIKGIGTVINFDAAKSIETHVHRVGRTGRMGVDGTTPGLAITLLTPKEVSFAGDLARNLAMSGQTPSAELLALARKNPRFTEWRPDNSNDRSGSGSGFATLSGVSSFAQFADSVTGAGDPSSLPYEPMGATLSGRGRGKHMPLAPGLGFDGSSGEAAGARRSIGSSRFSAAPPVASSLGSAAFMRARTSGRNFLDGSLSVPLTGSAGAPMDAASLSSSAGTTTSGLAFDAMEIIRSATAAAAAEGAAAAQRLGRVDGPHPSNHSSNSSDSNGVGVDHRSTAGSAGADDDDADDDDLTGDGDAELSALRKRRTSRFSSVVPSSSGGALPLPSARDVAIAELQARVNQGAATGFQRMFVSGGTVGGGAGVITSASWSHPQPPPGPVASTSALAEAIPVPASAGDSAAPTKKRSRWDTDAPSAPAAGPAALGVTSSPAVLAVGTNLPRPAGNMWAAGHMTAQPVVNRSLYVPGVRY